MRKGIFLLILLVSSQYLFAQNEVGTDGDKLIWLILFFVVPIVGFIFHGFWKRTSKTGNKPFISRNRIQVKLEKDKLYYPDNLKLTVKNTGNTDIDLDRPMLVFSNSWLKRKFRLKGSGNRIFYPLFLEVGKTHDLEIDLNRFYRHDKSLKKFPKATIKILDVKGKNLGCKSLYLRKTLVQW